MTGSPIEHRFLEFVQRGDPEALADVFDRTAPRLFGVARHLAADAAAAEDLLQATFLTAIEKRRSFAPGRPLLPWLLGILRLHAIRLRAHDRRVPDPARVHVPAAADPLAIAAADELQSQVLRAADRLAPPYRSVLVLKLLHGLSPAEIAVALGDSPGAVRTRLHRALRQLRNALPGGVTIPAWIALPMARDLGAVRSELLRVLSHHPVVPLSSPPLLAAGVLTVKNKISILVALLVLTASVATWSVCVDRPSVPVSDVATSPPAPEIKPAEPTPTPRVTREPAESRTADAPPTASPARPAVHRPAGSLAVQLRTVGGGEPVPNARVAVCSTASGHAVLAPVVRHTDDAGTVVFEALDAGPYRVQLDRRGPSIPEAKCRGEGSPYACATAVVTAGETTRIELRIEDGLRVDGLVVDPGGNPVAGATVWCAAFSAPPHPGEPVARTDAEGRFRLHSMSGDHWISARAPGHGPSRAFSPWRSSQPGGHQVSLRLELGTACGNLKGTVRDRSGTPLAGAEVVAGAGLFEAGCDNSDCGMWAHNPVPGSFSTDATGNFTLSGLAPGPLPLRATARGCSRAETVVTIVAGDTATAELVLERGCLVRGLVADAERRPIEGALVTTRRDDTVLAAVRSDARGQFLLDGLPAGALAFLAAADHFRPARQDVDGRAGGELSLDFVLEPMGRMTGLAVTHDRIPFRGWRVEARPVQALADAGESRSGPVGEDGSFAIETDARLGYRLALIDRARIRSSDGLPAAGPHAIPCDWLGEVAGGQSGVQIVVPAELLGLAVVRGRVLDAVGAVFQGGVVISGGEGAVTAYRDLGPDGRFVLGPILPGAYDVRVQPRDAAVHAPLLLARCQLTADARQDLGELRLRASGQLVLDVQIEAGQGLHAYVLDEQERQVTQLVVEPQQRARQALPAGNYLLRAFVIGTFGHGSHRVEQKFRVEVGAECTVPVHIKDPNQGKEERAPRR